MVVGSSDCADIVACVVVVVVCLLLPYYCLFFAFVVTVLLGVGLSLACIVFC